MGKVQISKGHTVIHEKYGECQVVCTCKGSVEIVNKNKSINQCVSRESVTLKASAEY